MGKDKKFLLLVSIIFSLLIAVPAGAYIFQKVSSYSSKYTMTASLENDENVAVVLSFATSTETKAVLIDRSDRTMFPHYLSSNELRVSQIDIDWYTSGDIASTASTTIRIGVIASTTPSGAVADIAWFEQISFDNADASKKTQHVSLKYSPSLLKLGNFSALSATTTGFLTNLWTIGSTGWATSTANKICPIVNDAGTQQHCYPGVKDLVMDVYNQDGLATTTVKVFYHTK